MSTPIVSVAVQVEVTSWTPPASGSGPYIAQATMVVGNNSTGVTVTNNVIDITVPEGTPVQINLNPWTDLPTIFTLGAPYKEVAPTGDGSEYSIVLLDRDGLFTSNGSAQWTYKGTAYTLAAIPTNGVAVIDLNNGLGEDDDFTYNLTLMDSNGNWGIFDPGVSNDPNQ